MRGRGRATRSASGHSWFCFLVASPCSGDLLLFAKNLFVAAKIVWHDKAGETTLRVLADPGSWRKQRPRIVARLAAETGAKGASEAGCSDRSRDTPGTPV